MKKLIIGIFLLAFSAAPALADNCSAYPYILLNGVTADANQVMANFNSILSCGNNQLLARNNNLSDLQSASTARTNLGLGTAATAAAADNNTILIGPTGTITAGEVPYFTSSGGTVGSSGIQRTDILTKPNNLAGLSSPSTARTNLGLGSIATANVTYSTAAPSGSANTGDIWVTYVP